MSTPSVGAVVSSVETKLREMWQPSAGQPTLAHACTMNLVVVGAPDVIDRYTTIVDEVTSSIPARALLLALDPEGAPGLDADVSAICGVGADATCSERITLRASGAICARAASIVDALRVPELATVVVWLGRVHVEDPVFVGVAGDATRVVLDTEYTSLSSLLSLARWTRARSAERRGAASRQMTLPPPGTIDMPYIADLAWTRLGAWQEMIARFFDDPRLTPHADHVKRVELIQASEPGARVGSEVALFLGWLSTRLGWRLAHMGGKLRLVRQNGDVVQLALTATQRPATIAPAALIAVKIEAEREGVTLKGVVERDVAGEVDVLVWRSQIAGQHGDAVPSAEQRVRLGANKGGRLLERTLHRAAYDPALMESAQFAEEVAEEGLVVS